MGGRGGGEEAAVAGPSVPSVHRQLPFKPQSTARHQRLSQEDTGIIQQVPERYKPRPHHNPHRLVAACCMRCIPGSHVVSGVHDDVIASENVQSIAAGQQDTVCSH